jgi:glycerol-3-phosphate dehydrogenase
MMLQEVLGYLNQDTSLADRIIPSAPDLRAEVVHAAQRELVVCPEDFVCQRTALQWDRDNAREAYEVVEQLLRSHAPVVAPDLALRKERYFQKLVWLDHLCAQ